MGFPGGLDGKESACNVEDSDSILGSGRSPGERNGYSLQYSCLENPMDYIVVPWMTERLSLHFLDFGHIGLGPTKMNLF